MTAFLLVAVLQQAPAIDADAGFFGDVYYDSWARLSAVVANPGDEIEGELQVTVRSRNVEPVVFRRPVTLPARVRKKFSWDAYASGWEDEAEFRLLGKGGRVLARTSVTLRFRSERERQVLQVGTALSSLLAIEEGLGAAFTQTSAERLPDTLPPLLALDAIVFPEAQPLEPAQEAALVRWVELGGRLVFAPGRTAALQNRFWRDLCPLAGMETRTVKVGKRESPVPLTTGRLRAGGAFLSLGEQPAAFRYARGRGEVVFLAFPPDQSGLEEALPAATLWRAALDPAPRKDEPVIDPRRGERRLGWQSNSSFMSGLSTREAPMPLGLLLAGGAALSVYVAWIGPWHYFRLKRKARLRRGPVAFGAVAGVFLMLSLAWASVFAAREVRLGHLVLADEGLVQSFSVLQAGGSRVYDLEGTGTFAPMDRLVGMGGGREGRQSEVDDRLRARVPLPALATRGLAGARVPGAGEIGVTCRWAADGAGLEVVNDGPLRLRDCRLVTREGIRSLGEVGPGSRRTMIPAEHPQIGFPEWLKQVRGMEQVAWWWWAPAYFWSESPVEEHPFMVTFFERIQRATEERGIVHRFRQRRLDLSFHLDRGEAVFTASFDEGASGVRLGQGADTRTYGLVRVVVAGGGP